MAYLSTDTTKNSAPSGAAGVAWWKQALSVGGDVLTSLFPKIKEWLGTADKTSANDLLTWLQANTNISSKQYEELQKTAQTQTWVLIGIVGAAVLGGFYFMNKKSTAMPAVKVKA